MADRGFEMVRYADDFVVLCRSESEAVSALAMLRDSVEAAGLTLHPTNTRIVDSRSESFAFLGYSFRGEKIYPRRESLSKIKARLVQSTARTRSGSIEAICMELTSVLRGWFYHLRGPGLEDPQSPTAIAAPTASEQPDTFPTSRT
jgi:RNA-directed DNA polymerase